MSKIKPAPDLRRASSVASEIVNTTTHRREVLSNLPSLKTCLRIATVDVDNFAPSSLFSLKRSCYLLWTTVGGLVMATEMLRSGKSIPFAFLMTITTMVILPMQLLAWYFFDHHIHHMFVMLEVRGVHVTSTPIADASVRQFAAANMARGAKRRRGEERNDGAA